MTGNPDQRGGAGQRSVPLSALEHIDYCHRQAALIHLEATWSENFDTVRGDLVHHAVDLPAVHRRRGTTVIRSLPVYSQADGLHSICDLVEFTVRTATPVEYKVGPYRTGAPADVQLAGQAACLAEAGFVVPVGYVYSATDRRRHQVVISEALLRRMRQAAEALRALLARKSGRTRQHRPSGAGEDRNSNYDRIAVGSPVQHRPSGAGEDRNLVTGADLERMPGAAPALRAGEDRNVCGLHRYRSYTEQHRPSGAGEDRNTMRTVAVMALTSSTGPPGLVRIATSIQPTLLSMPLG